MAGLLVASQPNSTPASPSRTVKPPGAGGPERTSALTRCGSEGSETFPLPSTAGTRYRYSTHPTPSPSPTPAVVAARSTANHNTPPATPSRTVKPPGAGGPERSTALTRCGSEGSETLPLASTARTLYWYSTPPTTSRSTYLSVVAARASASNRSAPSPSLRYSWNERTSGSPVSSHDTATAPSS